MFLNGGSLVETVLAKFPEKKKVPDQGDDIFSNWNFQDFQDSGYLNFRAGRADLFALSIMVENYASKHNSPLLASFETDNRWKFVEDRYIKLMKKLPRVWVIGNFNNPHLAQNLPQTAQVISCVGTELAKVWAVVTRGPDGPIGLIAEEIGIKMFRGFFTTVPEIAGYAVNRMALLLATEFDFSKKEYDFAKGGY